MRRKFSKDSERATSGMSLSRFSSGWMFDVAQSSEMSLPQTTQEPFRRGSVLGRGTLQEQPLCDMGHLHPVDGHADLAGRLADAAAGVFDQRLVEKVTTFPLV